MTGGTARHRRRPGCYSGVSGVAIYNLPLQRPCRGPGSAEGRDAGSVQRSTPGDSGLGARSHSEQAASVFVTPRFITAPGSPHSSMSKAHKRDISHLFTACQPGAGAREAEE